MTTPTTDAVDEQDLYPDSDGQPMSDNTLQYEWIVTIKGNLDGLYRDAGDVFVAGDLLWYAVEGQPAARTAPDVLVAFGRPKGYRGSYKQWEEGGVAPQVVFEILSPGNRAGEMERKFEFYQRHGVEEYYVYDPDRVALTGYHRSGAALRPVEPMDGWTSPRLGIRFDLSGPELTIRQPDGRRFLTFAELMAEWEQAQHRVAEAEARATQDRRERAEAEARADQDRREREAAQAQAEQDRRERAEAQARAERLAARLRELGIDPEN